MNKRSKIYRYSTRFEQVPTLSYLAKWLVVSFILGGLAGSASALLLVSLEWATNFRESHLWMIALLPLAGLVIGLMYHYLAGTVSKGNNFLIEEIHSPHDIIPFRMAPLVYIGTVLTHLFGGSAGREGTGVQMSGAIAEKLAQWLHMGHHDRKIMVMIGISAGFASIFGTPLAGAVFGLEVIIVGRMRYEAILPSFLASSFAALTCHAWGMQHTQYVMSAVPQLDWLPILWVALAGVAFGVVAMIFSRSVIFWSALSKKIKYAPLRPFVGGVIIALAVYMLGTTKYIGLGVPTIVAAFSEQQMWYDFILKLIFTTFTIGVGFKGGEVTPLFFVGATLGSFLALILPLPMGFLAGLGFVAVFAGATNTPIACTLMGIELFGAEPGIYLGIACVVAYLFSGHTSIYTSQLVGSPKNTLNFRKKGHMLK